jgi:hypothetical protein
MKKLLILALIISFSNISKACQLSIPESYVPTFLNPPVSGHYEKCESEPCHCVDKINPYFSELIDNEVIDYISKTNETSCTDELDCDAKFIEISCSLDEEKIKNYDLLNVYCTKPIYKIEGKKLVESEEKKAAYKAARKAEKDLELDKKEAKKLLKLSIKEDIKNATTVAKLKALIEKMIEAQE